MKINIAVHEPTDAGAVGGFEWRTDRAEAEKEFRSFRSTTGTTYLFTDVTPPSSYTTSDQITDWVDGIYWVGGPSCMVLTWGEPTKVHGAVRTPEYRDLL